MPLDFEKRYVHEAGSSDGEEWIAVKPTESGSLVYWSITPGGAFAKMDLRKYRTVRKEEEKLAEITYRPMKVPTPDEKEAILEALDAHIRGEGGGDRVDRIAGPRLLGREDRGDGWGARPNYTSVRTPYRRSGWDRRKRFVQRAKEASAGQLVGGFAVSGGVVFKLWANFGSLLTTVARLFYNDRGEKTEFLVHLEKFVGRMDGLFARANWIYEKCSVTGGWCLTNYDTVFLLLAFLYMLYYFFFRGDGDGKAKLHRDEDREQIDKLESLLKEQHKENVDERARLRDEMRRGDGDGGAGPGRQSGLDDMEGRLNAYQGVNDADRGKSGGVAGRAGNDKSYFGKMRATVQKLLSRAQNPLERVVFLIRQIREMEQWNFPAGYTTRLSGEFASALYRDGSSGRQFARNYRHLHRLEGCTAFNAFEAICDISDAMILDDRIDDLFNTHGYERLARWGYGLMQVMSEVTEERHWKGEKKQLRTRGELLKRFHVTEAYSAEAQVEVTEELKNTAIFRKYLQRAGDDV